MKKLLIIEDDPIVANIYRNKFLAIDYHVEVALRGEDGLDLLRRFTPDAILLDLMLPQMSGLDLIKNIRSQPALQHLPIIVFSNTYLTNMVQDAWKAGATKCLSKASCSPKHVLEAVESSLLKAQTGGTSAATAPAQAVGESDAASQGPLQKELVESLPETLNVLRTLLKNLLKASDEASRVAVAQDLYRRIHSLTSNAGLCGFIDIARMCEALEALLKELQEKPDNINGSTMRTLASGIDVLALLFGKASVSGAGSAEDLEVLVVDDEPISRRAITSALDKVRLKSHCVEDPATALEELSKRDYDLVFLDIDMPGMNGLELCAKLREMPRHAQTPVVFVTALNDFKTRANSLMSGGNDFIGKPFLFVELAVKALVYLLRGKLQAR